MTAILTRASGVAVDDTRVARRVVARVVGAKAGRSGLGWGVVFGVYVATQALAYATSYKTAASRQILVREFAHNVGISALVGPARRIGTVPGYTAWKCLTVLAIVGAVWGILTSTKLTRGEEEAGRWELLLVGQTTRRHGALQALAGLGVGLFALWVTTSIIIVAVGRSTKVGIGASAGVFFALAIVSGALMFLAVGSFCAQLGTSRRQGASYASALLAVSYAIRMVADSSTNLGWLRWTTPLGWVEQLQPLTSPRPFALVPIIGFTAVLATGTIYLAGRRDLGAGVLADHSSVVRVRALTTRPFSLAVFLSRSMLVAWAVSIIAYGLLLGGIAKSGGKIITSSPSLGRVFSRLGVTGAEAYLSVALLIMAVALAFVALGQVSAVRKEESSGQLDNLLVRAFSRSAWLSQRVALGTIVLVLGGLLAGCSTWVGAALDHESVGFTLMLTAGLNVAVPAFLLFGVGILTLALAPRLVSAVTYGLFVWCFLIEIVAGIANVNHWVLDLSAFHQMAAAPATPIAWTANALMCSLALVSILLGAFVFARRDLTGE